MRKILLLLFILIQFPLLMKAQTIEWSWIKGSKQSNALPVYGTKGVTAASNLPGGRNSAASSKDAAGNVWVFGGGGVDNDGNADGFLNDLWKWDGTNWTWVSGAKVSGASGVYGTKGVADAANVPGARYAPVAWTDASGNFWLFGGLGFDVDGNFGFLNDLWKWDGSNWTWVSGNNTTNQIGIYGSQGLTDAGNQPGGRCGSSVWKDSGGNLWLFGGQGYGSQSTVTGALNDIWKWDGSNWTWVKGDNVINEPGIYGTKGVAAETNKPGTRYFAAASSDAVGNVYLFGGQGTDENGNSSAFNDLWKWDGTDWTWISGPSVTTDSKGYYGTKNVAAAANLPGARSSAQLGIDNNGKIWLFGGWGYDAEEETGYLNDLWFFNGTQWTWESGSDEVNSVGNYNTQSQFNPTNLPSGHSESVSWIGNDGLFYLFGGYGIDNTNADQGLMNDVWVFKDVNTTLLFKLNYFKGVALANGDNQLSWSTTEELNTSHFELERSYEGNVFTSVAKIAALGTPGSYNYLDQNLDQTKSKVYYRLKMVNLDGTYVYSEVISLNLKNTLGSYKIYPNPLRNGLLTVNYPVATTAGVVRIYNVSGSVLLSKSLATGTNQAALNLSSLSAGMYFVDIRFDNEHKVIKLMIQQ